MRAFEIRFVQDLGISNLQITWLIDDGIHGENKQILGISLSVSIFKQR